MLFALTGRAPEHRAGMKLQATQESTNAVTAGPSFEAGNGRPRKTSILYVIDTLEVGGTETSLLQLVARLDRKQIEPIVCSLYQGERLRAEFEAVGVRVICLGLSGKYQFLAAFQRLRRVVREERPSLIHTMLFRASQVGRVVGRIARVPIISSFVNVPYDPMRLKVDTSVSQPKLHALRLLDSTTARFVTRFHAVSQTARDSNCKHLGVPSCGVTVIPRGREVDRYSHEHRSTPDTTLKNESPGGYPVVVNVGRLIGQKGQIHLIHAVPQLLRKFPSLQVRFAGEGPLHAELADIAAQMGAGDHVTFLGRHDDVPGLLASADVFVFPSLYEGMPGAVIEAMLAGCPIVASNIPQVAELIENRETGLLVRPGDPQALAVAIDELVSNREFATRLGRKARDVACKCYDIRVVVRQMERLYESVLAERAL